MRELSLSEIGMVSGGGAATDTMHSTAQGAGYGYVAAKVVGTTLRGAAAGSRAGLYGAVAGAAVGLTAGIYDAIQDSKAKDGSDYNTR